MDIRRPQSIEQAYPDWSFKRDTGSDLLRSQRSAHVRTRDGKTDNGRVGNLSRVVSWLDSHSAAFKKETMFPLVLGHPLLSRPVMLVARHKLPRPLFERVIGFSIVRDFGYQLLIFRAGRLSPIERSSRC